MINDNSNEASVLSLSDLWFCCSRSIRTQSWTSEELNHPDWVLPPRCAAADHSWSQPAGTDKEAVLSDRKWTAAEERSVNSLHQRAESGGFSSLPPLLLSTHLLCSLYSQDVMSVSGSNMAAPVTISPEEEEELREAFSKIGKSTEADVTSCCWRPLITVWLYKWSLLPVCLWTVHLFYSASRSAVLKADQTSEYFNVNGPEAKLITGQTVAEHTEFSKKKCLRMSQVCLCVCTFIGIVCFLYSCIDYYCL